MTARTFRAAQQRQSFLLALGLLLLLGLAGWKLWPRSAPPVNEGPIPPPEDPRLAFATPYRNVRPDVKYVGDAACTGCHASQTKGYREHPMGRSLAPVQSATQLERYDAAAKNPFDALGFHYQIDRRGERVFHRETASDVKGQLVSEMEAEIAFAVGSGTRGRTYLINRAGYLFQSPITWYPEKGAWDLSPGHERLQHHFGRPVPTDCLFCHSNRVHEVAESQNHYEQPIFDGHTIGCERCHGPGELHVRRQDSGESYEGADNTIVNPARLEPTLREAVCEQCHLQGLTRVLRRGRQAFDFRPGLPVHLFLAMFVKPPSQTGDSKFVGQVEQMHASRCFQASNGKMGCLTCHNPHEYPPASKRVAYYRDRCQQCHADKGCSVSREVRVQTSKDDNCLHCHMPAGPSDIQHHSITDHRIPRRPASVATDTNPANDDMPMLLFHRSLLKPDDREAARDLGIALMDRVERYAPGTRRELGRMALPRLEAALRADPSDVNARDAKAHAQWAVGDVDGAAETFAEVLSQSPRREIALQWAAALALERKRPEDAINYLERANEVNPWRHEFHYLLAEAQAQRRQWQPGLAECQKAIKLNPANLGARRLLVECLLQSGKREQARTEFERLLALNPPNAEALRKWFAQRAP
jgi:Flp pilus assembly protein TadD